MKHVNLESMFGAMAEGVMGGDSRYAVSDAEHITDTKLGLTYHLYPEYKKKPYKISLNDVEVINGMQMTRVEANILNKVKDFLTKWYADKQRHALYEMSIGNPMVDLSDGTDDDMHVGNGNYSS